MDAKTGEMSGCPFSGDNGTRALFGRTNRDWWPETTQLDILTENGRSPNPYGDDYDYAEAFNALDYSSLKADIKALMTDSKEWWPADYGHYGPFFIRMAWLPNPAKEQNHPAKQQSQRQERRVIIRPKLESCPRRR